MSIIYEVLAYLIAFVFLLILLVVLVKGTKGPLRGGGNSTMMMLGTMDAIFDKEKKRAAEEIVERNAGKKMEEQGSKEPKKPGITDS